MNAITVRDQASLLVEDISTDLRAALPSNIPYDKFRAHFLTAVANNPEILTCDLQSVKTALMKSAVDNLVPDNREAALVPFWTRVKQGDREVTVKLCQYMPMVYGIRKRALELGGARIGAECVHENDFYESEQGDEPFIKHKRAPLGKPRGAIIGAYAIFRDENDKIIHREEMSKDDIEAARQVSKAAKGPGWTNFYGEMAKKTVIRRGAKSVPSIPDNVQAIINRDDDYVSFEPEARSRSIEHNPLVDDQRSLTNSSTAPLDTGNPHTSDHFASQQQEQSQSSGASQSQAPRTEVPDEKAGSQESHPRLPAEIFRKYTSALGRMATANNVRKAHESFWTDYGKPAEGTADHMLAGKILNLHNLRVEGKAEGNIVDEIDGLITESFGEKA